MTQNENIPSIIALQFRIGHYNKYLNIKVEGSIGLVEETLLKIDAFCFLLKTVTKVKKRTKGVRGHPGEYLLACASHSVVSGGACPF